MQEFATGKATFSKALPLTCLFKSRKAVRIMKITGILIMAACLQLSARGLTQTVTISVKDAPLLTVLNAIAKQTGFTFFADSKDLQKANKVSITAKNLSVVQVLDLCFKDQPLTYSIVDKIINVAQKEPTRPLSNIQSFSDTITVRGRVMNSNGDPVQVSVIVKGTNQGTSTNENGEFLLKNVDENAVLLFTGVGLEATEVKLNGNRSLNVKVKIDIAPLQETIIKGYYTTSRTFNTGNVSKIKSDELRRQPVGDPMVALAGKVPGLFISQSSGVPGRAIKFNLRGLNSIQNGNDPLFIIDGVPFPSTPMSINGGGGGSLSPFNDININDIESIEVLKDADATAIYGSRGANGVILITTKKGMAGKTKFDVNVYKGWGKVANEIDLMNTQQYLKMKREAYANDGISVYPSTAYDVNGRWDTTRYTDWQKVFIGGTSSVLDGQISVSGGNADTKFLISENYRKETTVFPGDFYNTKNSVHLNLSHVSQNKKFHLNFLGNYVNGTSALPSQDLTSNLRLAPDAPAIYGDNGLLNWEGNTWTNPFAILRRSYKTFSKNLIGNIELGYSLVKGLDFKVNAGYTNYTVNEVDITPLSSFPPTTTSTTSRENRNANISLTSYNIEPQLNYRLKANNGELNILVGSTFSQVLQNSIYLVGRGFNSDDIIENIASAATIIPNYTYSKYRYNAFFGRINYQYKDKYLINATGRRDGSTRYGPENRFGNFGAIGAGWIFSKENFVAKNLSFLSFGKIRGSYGITGNDQIGDYNFMSTYSSDNYSYQGSTGLTPTRLPNPYYAWEKVKKLEAGLELGFLRDRLLANVSFYQNRTVNQVVQSPLPSLTGASFVIANLPAVVQNKGLEFELNATPVSTKNLTWRTSANLTIPRNKLVSFPDIETTTYANTYLVGQPLTVLRKLHYTGVNPQTGLYMYEDVNTDGSLSYPTDYLFTKKIAQDFFGGFSNTLIIGGFQFDMFFSFVKQTGYNYLTLFPLPPGAGVSTGNQPAFILDNRWQKSGDDANTQKFTTSTSNSTYTAYNRLVSSSDGAIGDASFIRLRNASLSYTLPRSVQRKMHTENARIYVQGQNLLTITSYKGLDPETRDLLPPIRMVVLGIQLTF